MIKNDVKVARITDIDFSFPSKYEPNTIVHKQRNIDAAIKEFQVRNDIVLEQKKREYFDPREKSDRQLAAILEQPNKIAELPNSYHAFKKLGNIYLPQFLRHK